MKEALKKALIGMITAEAKAALALRRPKIVGVTGSVGKTSTKDAAHAVVSAAFTARKSEKSQNSEIGIPLSVLGLDNAWSSASGWAMNLLKGLRAVLGVAPFPEWLVLEVGADHPGDIKSATEWVKPDVAILTRMSETPVHVEYFTGPEQVLEEKMHLARAVRHGGAVIVNADDPLFMGKVTELAKERPDLRVYTFGRAQGSDVRIVESEVSYDSSPLSLPIGTYCVLRMGGTAGQGLGGARVEKRVEVRGVVGDHLMYPVAAAVALAVALGIESHVPSAFYTLEPAKGRMRIVPGKEKSVIIDDSYNSSPVACEAALKALGSLSVRGRRIAVLGDMKELGSNATTAHEAVGRLAAETVHTLVTVGELSRGVARGARRAGLTDDRIMEFAESGSAAEALKAFVRAGDAVLVKGSQSMRMERVSKAIMAEPERANEYLPRQEEEWLKR